MSKSNHIKSSSTKPQKKLNYGRNYYLILIAVGVASLGEWLYRLALPIAVLQMTGSANTTAIMYILEFVPFILLGPLAGAIADRVNRRSLIVSMQISAAIIAGILAIILNQPWVNYVTLFVFGFLLSSTQAFFYPALQGLIQTSVPTESLPILNSRKRSIESVFTAVGPAIGAATIAFIGISGAIVINSITFFLAACIIIFVSIQKSHVTGKIKEAFKVYSLILEAITYLRTNRPLLSGVILFGGANFGLMAIQANLIYIVINYFGLSNFIAGIVLGAGGVGSIIGAYMAPKIHTRLKTGNMIVLSMFASGILMSCMVINSWITLALIWASANAMVSNIVVPWLSFQQSVVPTDMLGRVSSVGRMISFVAIPAGAFAGGVLIENYNTLWPLAFLGGGSMILMAILGRITPLWKAEFNKEGKIIEKSTGIS